MDKILEILPVALEILGGLVIIMTAIAAVTKTEWDDKAVGILGKLKNFLGGFAHDSAKKLK